MVRNYRDGYGMFAVNGILFNHESPRRGATFVTRKITRSLARIMFGLENRLYIGNLEAKRDWGYAPDYVEAMRLMLQQEEPDDYVIATGETHSVRDFIDFSFAHAGIEIEWKNKGKSEKGIVRSLTPSLSSVLKVGDTIVEIDPRYFRPLEVDFLQGDASRARKKLNWEPRVTFEDLVKIMVDSDIKDLEEMRQCQDVIRKMKNNKKV
jgi:GDPmannose 4,6-dehydratase